MATDYLTAVLRARVYEVATESPLEALAGVSRRVRAQVLLKREDTQVVHSFKLRGAYNKIAGLPAAARRRGVVAASAGNHAQGVALAAQRLALRAVVVMPTTTPEVKVSAVRALGAQVYLHGDGYDDAHARAAELAAEQGLTVVHPYDDPDVIAGQGTIGAEILRQVPGRLDAIYVPVGGGGLIGGIAAYVKRVRPAVRIVGVGAEDADAMARSLAAGRRVRLPAVGLFVDGVAVRQVGRESFRLARRYVDEMVTVSVDAVCAAVRDAFEDTRAILEPAGALALAGLKQHLGPGPQGRVAVAIASGGNAGFDRLRHIAERAEVGDGGEVLFAATIPERPGSFRAFCNALGRAVITEFNYRYDDPARAQIFVGVKLRGGAAARAALYERLRVRGYGVEDLSGNEVAREHVRHMVGGRARVADEVLYRFEFPERPGALAAFLDQLGGRWNISLFHYRNHAAAYGRVLAGLQVPPAERAALRRFVAATGFDWVDESANPAYGLFLR